MTIITFDTNEYGFINSWWTPLLYFEHQANPFTDWNFDDFWVSSNILSATDRIFTEYQNLGYFEIRQNLFNTL